MKNRMRFPIFHYFYVVLLLMAALPAGADTSDTNNNGSSASDRQLAHFFGGPNTVINAVCFLPDSKHVILAMPTNNSLQVISTVDWHIERTVALNQTPGVISVSPDGTKLAVGGSRDLTIWDTGRWQPKQHFPSPENFLFFPDGRMLLVGKKNSTLISGNTQIAVPNSNYWGDFIGLAVSPNGKALALGGYGWLKVLDTNTWKTIRYYQNLWKDDQQDNDWVRIIEFSPDGSLMAAAAVNCKTTPVWETVDWHKVYTIHQDGGFSCVSFSPKSRDLVTVGIKSESDPVKTMLNLWSSANGKSIGSIADRFREFAMPQSACFSPDGQMIATQTEANWVVIWYTTPVPNRKVMTHALHSQRPNNALHRPARGRPGL